MKVIITTTALVFATLVSAGAFADRDDRKHGSFRHQDRYQDRHHDRQYDRHHKHDARHHLRHGREHSERRWRGDDRRFRLYIPANVRGSTTLRLGKMLRYHHGIDINDYNLNAVILHNGDAYPKTRARVYVGERSTGLYLHEGRNRIRAPHGHGRWKVRLKHVNLTGVTVLMEPKARYARYGHRYGHRPRYAFGW
jgi:hypothetical protein